MRVLALAALWLLASTSARSECECLWQGSFTDVEPMADLVVAGSVEGGKGNSIDLRIKRVLRGDNYEPEVRIWLKTGNYCRPEPESFPKDSAWVMALIKIKDDVDGGFSPYTPNVSYGRVGDYYLSSCGGYWLSLHGEWVTGNLVKAPRWAREPEMTPVLLDLVADFVKGKVSAEALAEASREDPEVRELMLDTKEFLRGAN